MASSESRQTWRAVFRVSSCSFPLSAGIRSFRYLVMVRLTSSRRSFQMDTNNIAFVCDGSHSWPLFGRGLKCVLSLSSPAGVSCGMADRCLTKGNAKVLVISLSLLVLISERKHRGGRVSLGRDIIGLEKGAFSLSKFEFDTSIIHQSASTSCPRLS